MHDLPRQKLSELVAEYGHGLCDDAKRLEGMLKDVLRNEHKREMFVLVSALREGVAAEFRNSVSGMPLSAVAAKLVRQLQDNLALDETAARWAVESWAFALGVKITQPVVRAKKPAPSPVMDPTSSPTISPKKGIDLAAMVLQQRAKEEQEKEHAEAIHQQARKLADDGNDYEAAIRLLDSPAGVNGHPDPRESRSAGHHRSRGRRSRRGAFEAELEELGAERRDQADELVAHPLGSTVSVL